MRAAPYDTLLDDMGMDHLGEHELAAQMALEGATLWLKGASRYELDQATGLVDDFLIDVQSPQWARHHRATLGLSRGFVSSVTVVGADTFDNLTASPVTVTPANVDTVKGLVTIHALPSALPGYWPDGWWGIRYIRVTYNAGFAADGSDTQMYDQTALPSWIINAAKMRAMVLLASHPAFADAKAVTDVKTLADMSQTAVIQNARYIPSAQLPL